MTAKLKAGSGLVVTHWPSGVAQDHVCSVLPRPITSTSDTPPISSGIVPSGLYDMTLHWDFAMDPFLTLAFAALLFTKTVALVLVLSYVVIT